MIPKRDEFRGQSYKLYDDYNKIHLFVEDAGFENLYAAILNNFEIGVERIFSKNGKSEVLEAAKSSDDPKCVFLVDRDWDDLLGRMARLENVVVLDKHSIENYLIDYDAFAEIVEAEVPRGNIEDLLGAQHFADIVSVASKQLRPLFCCFVATQMSNPEIRSCSRKPGGFQVQHKSWAPDDGLINDFIVDAKVTVVKKVIAYFSDADLVSRGHGKYMLHFVWAGVREKSGVKPIGAEVLMMRLAQKLDSVSLHELVGKIVERVRPGLATT